MDNRIASYWTLPPHEQGDILHTEKMAELEQSGEIMIRYKGKMIRLEDYPCSCNLQAPDQCWEDMHPDKEHKGQQCKCRCHSVYEPY